MMRYLASVVFFHVPTPPVLDGARVFLDKFIGMSWFASRRLALSVERNTINNLPAPPCLNKARFLTELVPHSKRIR